MKLASSRDNAKPANLDAQGPETEGPSKTLAPPPFALDASPVQAKGLDAGDESGFAEEGEMQMKSKGSGAMQLKGADAGDAGGGDGGSAQDVLSNVSALTGTDITDSKVHYNSSKPKDVGALAYAQGSDIHLGPGQEKHLGHEAAHIAQQKQGRVNANTEVNGMPVNNDKGLEKEADDIGAQATQMKAIEAPAQMKTGNAGGDGAIQRVEDDNMSVSSDDSFHTAIEGPENSDLEQGSTQEIEIAIPGAFDVTDGPDKFHQYILAAIGNIATSNTFSVNVFFNINIGIKADVLKGMFGIGGGGSFGVNLTLNRQDDRLVRSGWTIKYGGQFVSDILWFIHYTHDWVGKSSRTAVFRDIPHCAAHVFDVLQEMYNKIADHADDNLPRFEYGDWEGPGHMNWEGLANRPATKVTGSENSHTNTVGLGMEGVNTSASASWGTHNSESHFYKENEGETITKTSTQEVKDASFGIEVDGVGVELAMAYTDIANHANSDNDGYYMNLSATFTNFPRMAKLRAGLAKDLQGITSALSGTLDPLVTLKLAAGLIAGYVKNQVSTMSAFERSSWQQMVSGASGKSEGSTSTSFTTELNFIRYGGKEEGQGEWALQYFRLSAGASAGVEWDASVPLASLYGVATLNGYTNGNAGADASAGMVEVLGANTVSYLITVYNGLVYTDAEIQQGFATDKFARWVNFRTSHMPAIHQMIKALGDPDSIPYKEATGSYGLDPGDPLIGEAAEAAATGTVSSNAIQLFENFLYRNYLAHRADGVDVASDTDTMDQALQDPDNARTPWYTSVGGTAKVFIDMANQASPVLKRSKYEPQRQSPNTPKTILDSLYQEQKVDLEWVVKRRESGGLFTSGGGRVISEREFSIPKGTSREEALAKLSSKFMSVLDEPGKFSPELLQANFAGTDLPALWTAYYEAKNAPAANRKERRDRNRDIASAKSAFIAAIDGAMPTLAAKVLSGTQIQEAGSDVVVEEGWFSNDDVLVVND